MLSIKETAPQDGYILPKWNESGSYRATAVAYMEREAMGEVENQDGNTYTLEHLKASLIGGESSLRAIKVFLSNGDNYTTSMASHLSNKQMTDYFAIGMILNIGTADDILVKVVKTEIIR